MTKNEKVLQQLIGMTRSLGIPEKDYVILGEGNTSARAGDHAFFVKASGAQMHQITAQSFVEMSFEKVLAIAESIEPLADDVLAGRLAAAKVDPTVQARPSLEVILHALALTTGQARFVGHTHPVAMNAILCSQTAVQAFQGRIFPDEIVVCGPAPAFVPYADPGRPLARQVQQAILRYLEEYGQPPKLMLMQNHGILALGKNPVEVESITAMAVKTARVIVATYALGGPRYLSRQDVDRIWTRPDEEYRKKKISGTE